MSRKFDLDAISLDELKSLHKQVAKAIEGYEDRKKREAMAVLKEKARDLGFSLDQLVGASVKGKKPRAKAGLKYTHPDNPEVTWSGRGRRPGWFEDAVSAGNITIGAAAGTR